ncbi:MAG: 4Fe-4S binding protein [candidate division Zixibacteria bacterium]|nr:4Fe-4S binding protein [candidate division Zixibacteria bacterium]
MPLGAWKWLRRSSQVTFLVVTYALVAATTYPLERDLPYDVIPRFSPLLAVSAAAASRAIIAAFWPALIVVGLTLLLGRAFCGWVCPVGTALDAGDFVIGKVFRKRKREGETVRHRRWRTLLLIALVVFTAFGIPLAGWFDPLSLFPRTLAASIIPYGNTALDKTTLLLYKVPALEGAAFAVRQRVVPENVTLFSGHLLITSAFVALVLLGLIRRRFYCRYVCPTGALLAVVGWASPFGRRVAAQECTECKRCRNVCRMGAIGGSGETTAQAECNLCMDCLTACRTQRASFGFGRKRAPENPTSWAPALTRRDFLAAAGASLAAAPTLFAVDRGVASDLFLIRPPGAREEGEFLARCVRCGECIRVCLTQGLAPVHFEAGLTGLWTPRLVPRVGYCEYLCTLCTQVCPSDALEPLSEEQKKKEVIGIALIDRTACLPWAKEEDCNVCEEMCPTAPKAIELRGQGRLKPHVLAELCVGCGICEYACPVEGPAAIRVVGDPTRAHVTDGRRAARRRYRRGRGWVQ